MAEHALYGKMRLCSIDVADFTDFQGIGKDPLYRRFDSVYSVVDNNISAEYKDFLSQPIYSSTEDQISWYVRNWKETPCPYMQLKGQQRDKYEKIKNDTLSEYNKVKDALSGEDKAIMIGALKYIDEEFLFCYDDKVVSVAWGMKVDDRHKHKWNTIHDLATSGKHTVSFKAGNHGSLSGNASIVLDDGVIIGLRDLPDVIADEGYDFKCWMPDPVGVKVGKSLEFVAVYEKMPEPEPEPEPEPVPEPEPEPEPEPVPEPEPEPVKEYVNVSFDAAGHGAVSGKSEFRILKGSSVDPMSVPDVIPDEGYDFSGWDKSIYSPIYADTVFHARYASKPAPLPPSPKIPWYRRLWAWLSGNGCLKWLIYALLILLLILLLFWLFKGCDDDSVKSIDKKENFDGRIIDDNGRIEDIVGGDGKLPDNPVTAPIIGDDGQTPPIVETPGRPDVIANRLNIYFENAETDLNAFAADMLKAYPQNMCTIIGFDPNIPMMQIMVPENQRDMIRETMNSKLPEYDFFVVDESIFTIAGETGDIHAGNTGWHLAVIDLKEGWTITKGNPDIVVAVVDDGVDASHDMLKGKIVAPYNVFTQDNRLSTGSGHGTHVAGLAVGSDKFYDKGVSGIAPGCKLMPVQVFDNGLCSFSSVTSGIMYAIHNGADVVNVSIGPDFEGMDAFSIEEQLAIAQTQFKNEEKIWQRIINVANDNNAIIVFAAGNNNILASIPPENRSEYTINVAAVNEDILGTDFTNYGLGSSISAPGKDILSSVPVNGYAVFDGTSMAAPIISGTVALMKSCDKSIDVSNALYILQTTGVEISDYMPPMVQVGDALSMLVNSSVSEGDTDNPVHVDVNEPDYDQIRRLIEEYKRKIAELEKMLPENQN